MQLKYFRRDVVSCELKFKRSVRLPCAGLIGMMRGCHHMPGRDGDVIDPMGTAKMGEVDEFRTP